MTSTEEVIARTTRALLVCLCRGEKMARGKSREDQQQNKVFDAP